MTKLPVRYVRGVLNDTLISRDEKIDTIDYRNLCEDMSKAFSFFFSFCSSKLVSTKMTTFGLQKVPSRADVTQRAIIQGVQGVHLSCSFFFVPVVFANTDEL